jgi:hypothetical protein
VRSACVRVGRLLAVGRPSCQHQHSQPPNPGCCPRRSTGARTHHCCRRAHRPSPHTHPGSLTLAVGLKLCWVVKLLLHVRLEALQGGAWVWGQCATSTHTAHCIAGVRVCAGCHATMSCGPHLPVPAHARGVVCCCCRCRRRALGRRCWHDLHGAAAAHCATARRAAGPDVCPGTLVVRRRPLSRSATFFLGNWVQVVVLLLITDHNAPHDATHFEAGRLHWQVKGVGLQGAGVMRTARTHLMPAHLKRSLCILQPAANINWCCNCAAARHELAACPKQLSHATA